ncbi:MAG: tyrosine-type recombinase/integrase [Croceibacterium sp.]
MAVGRITKRAVDAITAPRAGKRAYLWDDTLKGFGCMVTDQGSRSYLIQYRIGGRGSPTRRVTIGRHGSPWTPDTARTRAAELLEQVRRKVDPFDAQREALATIQARADEAEAAEQALAKLAFNVVADGYVALAKKSLRRWKEQEAIIDRDLRPVFGNTPLPSISADEINERLGIIAERSKSAALKSHVALRAIFAHAHTKHRKLFPTARSPFGEVDRPQSGSKRERHLDRREQRLTWEACKVLGWPFGPVYKLLLLTGARLREVAEARWSELDLEEASWLIPGNRMKNGEPHWIPLSPAALAIFKDLPRIAGKDGKDFVFTTNGETPVSGFSRAKARLDKAMKAVEADDARDGEREPLAIEQFVIHDTRRTFARGCQRAGTPPEVVERLLGHRTETESGVKGVYQVYAYEPERRAALDKWADTLAATVAGSARVVKLRGAA